MSSESYVIDPSPSDRDEVDSLPSISSSALDSDDDVDEAQEEWERSLEQLQMLLTMILIPFAGKYFGRKFAYWSEFPCCPARDGGLWAVLGEAGCGVWLLTTCRLGQVHGVDAQRRDTVDEQEDLQSSRRRGVRSLVIGGEKRERGEPSCTLYDIRSIDWLRYRDDCGASRA